MSTNSNSRILASTIAAAQNGTFTGLVQTLKGTTRLAPGAKRGGEKWTYGNDTVHVCLFTGFKYDALCQRSLDALEQMNASDLLRDMQEENLTGWAGRGAKAVKVELTLDDVQAALDRLKESWTLSRDGLNQSLNDEVFEPLVVDGVSVRGCRVYMGPTKEKLEMGGKPAAPVGTIYLQGLQISRKVLTPAQHGPIPASKSAPRVVAERYITQRTPMGAYRSYRLAPGTDFLLRAGGAAEIQAKKNGIVLTQELGSLIRKKAA